MHLLINPIKGSPEKIYRVSSTESVVLNPEYKINENRRIDFPLFKVVIKNARYCETALMIIALLKYVISRMNIPGC